MNIHLILDLSERMFDFEVMDSSITFQSLLDFDKVIFSTKFRRGGGSSSPLSSLYALSSGSFVAFEYLINISFHQS